MNKIQQALGIFIRMVLTAYGFLQFAVQVLWLGKWQMPRLIRGGTDPVVQRRKALLTAHHHVSFYLRTLAFLRLVAFRTRGVPTAEPSIVVANHPSLLDFIVFLRDFPYAICLYKSQSLNNPVLSSFVQVAGYIRGMGGQTGDSKRIISACSERLREGHPIVIFPEGTRSPDAHSMRKFRFTAFHAAIKSQVPVQPVAIYCEPLFLGKGQRWLDFCKTRNRITLHYLPPIQLEDLPEAHQSAAGLAAAAHDAIQAVLEGYH